FPKSKKPRFDRHRSDILLGFRVLTTYNYDFLISLRMLVFERSPMAGNSYVRSIVLFATTILTRLPFTSRFLYSQDSVQFALALEQYDVYIHQPHPPGYFLYMMAGKLINHFIQDANATFVVMSMFASGLSVALVYLLGRNVFNETVGWWAGLVATTSPLVWFYGEVALNYSVAAFLSGWIALLCWRFLNGDYERTYLSTFVLVL